MSVKIFEKGILDDMPVNFLTSKEQIFMELPKYNLQSLNPIERRLAKELKAVHEVCANNDFISYSILDDDYTKRPPRKYRINYNIKSFVGINEKGHPIVGENHVVDLEIPKHYPLESVMPYAKTDIWHPNIKWDGPYKGHICGNVKDFGKTYTLDLMIMRIANIIEYKNYLAENIPPFPEEEKAAKWIREFAEPNGFVNGEEGVLWDKIPEDSVVWQKEQPNEETVEEEVEEDNRLIKISIKGGKKPKTNPPPDGNQSSGGGFISIKPK